MMLLSCFKIYGVTVSLLHVCNNILISQLWNSALTSETVPFISAKVTKSCDHLFHVALKQYHLLFHVALNIKLFLQKTTKGMVQTDQR
jgi:hypothetical protein